MRSHLPEKEDHVRPNFLYFGLEVRVEARAIDADGQEFVFPRAMLRIWQPSSRISVCQMSGHVPANVMPPLLAAWNRTRLRASAYLRRLREDSELRSGMPNRVSQVSQHAPFKN